MLSLLNDLDCDDLLSHSRERERRRAVPLNLLHVRGLVRRSIKRRVEMDKDRVEGAATNIKGKVKEGVGKMTGDAKTEAEGQADQVKGKAQNAVGGLKDKAREVLNGDD